MLDLKFPFVVILSKGIDGVLHSCHEVSTCVLIFCENLFLSSMQK